ARRSVRMVVDLASGDGGGPLVEQAGQRPDQPGLTLAALAEQDDVVSGDQSPLQVRADRVVEAQDAGEWILGSPQPGDQVLPHLVLDAAVAVAARAQLAQSLNVRGLLAVWLHHVGSHHSTVSAQLPGCRTACVPSYPGWPGAPAQTTPSHLLPYGFIGV